jgi:hypothetical protein
MSALTFEQGWQAAQAELQARIDLRNAERLSQIPPQALEWLALVPVWTVGLARACGFPGGTGEEVLETLRRIHALGLCQRAPAAPIPGLESAERSDPSFERFWMSSDQRATQLARAIQAYESGRGEIHRTIQDLAERVRQAGRNGVPLLPIVDRWATLAAADYPGEPPGAVGRRLLERIEQDPPGQIARWLEAARPLEEIFKGEVTAAFVRALRRMEHQDRREADRRILQKYVVRPEQLQDFEELLNGPDDRWALHYVGAGGVGKTMLMRYLSVERIPALGGTSARIDFDHINPDYPSRTPGLLLVQLAEELRLQAPAGAAEDLFGSFFDKMTTLHEQLGSKPSASPEDPIASPLFDLALGNLVEAIQLLPRPVVLLLDTCEELSKVQLDGRVPRNVAATFRILEGLHDRDRALRVVFCGRRLLGSAGHGWRVDAAQSVHPPRSYLRLHVMRGFDHQESETFLDGAGVPRDLWEAILRRSPSVGFFIRGGVGRAAARKGEQYSPYSLDLHATWALERPDLEAAEILDNRVDPFVRIRILSRLPIALESLLPAVAILGLFDQPTLLAATGADPEGFDALFRELADQEWVARLGSGLVEVEPEMRTRLLEHVRTLHGPELEQVRRRALDHLKRKTVRDSGEVPVGELDPSEFEVALRLLEPFPAEAAEWWERVELGLARGGADEWTEDLTRRLLADGAVAGPRAEGESPLRPAILASLAAAYTRLRREVDTTSLWEEVLLKVSRHPLPDRTGTLRLRATAALAGQGSVTLADLERTIWEASPTGPDVQQAASVIAALERLTERLEGGESGGTGDLESLSRLAGRLIAPVKKLDPRLDAFLRTLAGRLSLRLKRPSRKAREHFNAALGIRRHLEPGAGGWLDWAPPDDLSARIALEFLRGTRARLLPAREVLAKLPDVPPRAGDVDTDRLFSAHLQLTGALAVPEIGSSVLSSFSKDLRPVCQVHRELPPSFAMEARTFGDAGLANEAIEFLASQGSGLEAAATELDSVLEAHRSWLYLAFRMRLLPRDGPSSSSPLFTPSALPADSDLAARWLATLPPSERAQFSFDTSSRAWLRHRPLLGDDLSALLAEQARDLAVPAPDRLETLDDLQRWTEALELDTIARKDRIELRRPPIPRKMPGGWQDLLRRLAPADAVSASLLRIWAVLDPSGDPAALPDTLADRLGLRKAAWVALDEGTLLSWRLPRAGARLLETAGRWFGGALDPFGETLARTSLGLVQARLRQPRADLSALRKSYEACRGLIYEPLASWDDLHAFLQNPDADPGGLGQRIWLPWLLRIAACLARDKGSTGRLVKALARVYGESGGEALLPPELELLRPPREPLLPKSPGLSYSTTAVPEPSSGSTEVIVRFRPLSFLASWPLPIQEIPLEGELEAPGRPLLRVEASSVRPGFEPYREVASRISWIGDLRRTLRRLTGSGRVLELEPTLGWICWEALLSVDPMSRDAYTDLRVFRWTLAKAMVRHTAPLSLPVKLTACYPSLGDHHMADRGWSALSQDPRFEVRFQPTQGLLDTPSPELETARVVHVIGRPTSTTAGARMMLGEAAASSTVGRGQLLAAHDLLRRSPQARLFLLQPGAKTTADRSGSDREQSAYLRHMATELHAAGAPAVLVLPCITQEQGTRLLSEVAAALREPGPALLPRLLEALEDAREILLGGSPPLPPEDCLEQALDITLFATANLEWNLPEGS